MRKYITKDNERWDSISYMLWGRPDLYKSLWDANKKTFRDLGYPTTVPAGTQLIIPDIENIELSNQKTPSVSPPWR